MTLQDEIEKEKLQVTIKPKYDKEVTDALLVLMLKGYEVQLTPMKDRRLGE